MKSYKSLIIYFPRRMPLIVRLSSLCMALMLAFSLLPAVASAHANNTPAAAPVLQMNVGFEDDSRLEYWTPVQISLNNDGPDFKGPLPPTTSPTPFQSAQVVAAIRPGATRSPLHCRTALKNRS